MCGENDMSFMRKKSMVEGRMDGRMEGNKAGLRIAYSNQKNKKMKIIQELEIVQ